MSSTQPHPKCQASSRRAAALMSEQVCDARGGGSLWRNIIPAAILPLRQSVAQRRSWLIFAPSLGLVTRVACRVMRKLHLPHALHRRPQQAPLMEDPVVRRYRFLLRTAPLDALEAAHIEALAGVPLAYRTAVLEAIRAAFVVGWRLAPDDVSPIARIVVRGERRHPGRFLRTCEGSALRTLAHSVLTAEASFGRLRGYATWDGSEPRILEEPTGSAWGEKWHDRLVANPQHTDVDGRRKKPVTAFDPP